MRIFISVILLIGSSLSIAQPPAYVFNGGIGDGYSVATANSGINYLSIGGSSDGYVSTTLINVSNFLCEGGDGDGYDTGYTQTNENFLATGGIGDGFAMKELKEKFVWTGAIGTSWTVAGNWSTNAIPDITREVIIPDGVPNWPFVNAGLLTIGKNLNSGNYRCASLWIQENAFLQTRINNRVENYGVLKIDGQMRVKKVTPDAFFNGEEGQIIISSTGSLTIKP